MLLNEFLKEHRKLEQLEKQIEALTAGLQKVTAQLAAALAIVKNASGAAAQRGVAANDFQVCTAAKAVAENVATCNARRVAGDRTLIKR